MHALHLDLDAGDLGKPDRKHRNINQNKLWKKDIKYHKILRNSENFFIFCTTPHH